MKREIARLTKSVYSRAGVGKLLIPALLFFGGTMIGKAFADFKKEQGLDKKRCIVGAWVDSLSEEDRKEINTIFFDDGVSTAKILSFLKTINISSFSNEALRKHRVGGCSCQTI